MLNKTCPVCKHDSLIYREDTVQCTNCAVYTKNLNFFMRLVVWAGSKQGWWWRLILLFWFVVMLVQNLQNPEFALNRLANPFSAVDFGPHELGHFLFIPFGQFMTIAGGSITQCLFPLVWLGALIYKRCYFAASLCLCWLGLNLFDVATYAGDARARLLPLSGPGAIGSDGSEAAYDAGHDWYQLLSRTGHLESDQAIAEFLRQAGTAVFVIGLLIGAVLVTFMCISAIRRWIDARAAAAETGADDEKNLRF